MRLIVGFAAAILLVLGSQSLAQINVDMNQITCRQWLQYNKRDRDFVRFWLSGYYNAAANSHVLNYERFQKNTARVAAYCKKNGSKTMPTAIKNTGLWK